MYCCLGYGFHWGYKSCSKRYMYCHRLWSFSLLHRDELAMAEFLGNCPSLLHTLRVPVVTSAILKLEPGRAGMQLLGPDLRECERRRKHNQPPSSSASLSLVPSKNDNWAIPLLFQIFEFEPVLNSRVHPFVFSNESTSKGAKAGGGETGRGGGRVMEQYEHLLDLLVRVQLQHRDPAHLLYAAYFLLLQGRIVEANRVFLVAASLGQSFVRISTLTTDELYKFIHSPEKYAQLQMQAAYMEAYLDMFSEQVHPVTAWRVKRVYADCKVCPWQQRFSALSALLKETWSALPADQRLLLEGEGMKDEIADEGVDGGAQVDQGRVDETQAGRSPSLQLETRERVAVVRVASVSEVCVRAYTMDVEVLFSSSPFMGESLQAPAYVAPAWSHCIPLPLHLPTNASRGVTPALPPVKADRTTTVEVADDSGSVSMQMLQGVFELTVSLPRGLDASTLLLEATGGGLRKTCMRPSCSGIFIEVQERIGQLRVLTSASPLLRPASSSTAFPLGGAYVKVFAKWLRRGTQVEFHKDGYTDRRGRFDYVTTSSCSRATAAAEVEKFAVLVIDDVHGSCVKEVNSPTL